MYPQPQPTPGISPGAAEKVSLVDCNFLSSVAQHAHSSKLRPRTEGTMTTLASWALTGGWASALTAPQSSMMPTTLLKFPGSQPFHTHDQGGPGLDNLGSCMSPNGDDNEGTSSATEIHIIRSRTFAAAGFSVAKQPLVQEAPVSALCRGKAGLLMLLTGHPEWPSNLQASPGSAPSLGPDSPLAIATQGQRRGQVHVSRWHFCLPTCT